MTTSALDQIEDSYPLSPMQEGFLYHSLYDPENYFEQFEYQIDGHLEVPLFERAWQSVVIRHSVLRTAFVWERLEQPLQVVARRVKLPLTVHDWREVPPAQQPERLLAFLCEDRRCGFKLSRAPLMRLTLIQLTDTAYRLIWSFHHLIMDGWSVSLVAQEAFSHYEALCQGQELVLEPARPYRDYIAWLADQEIAQAERFWRTRLGGLLAPTPLHVDRAPVAAAAGEAVYAASQMAIPAETTAALGTLARRHRLTLNTFVQGAWAALLSRYSGEPEVCFGVTTSGRSANLTGMESMVGCFINTLPLTVDVGPEQPVLPWLRELQQHHMEMWQYEYAPLVKVQGWSRVPRGQPLFDSILVFENYPAGGAGKEGLSVRGVQVHESTGYPLTLIASPGSELFLKIIYDQRRFAGETISRMLGHMRMLLEGMAADPEQPLGALPLLTPDEHRTMVAGWNQTATEGVPRLCLHDLIAEQAALRPQGAAVVDEHGHRMTYGELERKSSQLAFRLRELGCQPGDLVGICMERTPELMVGVLAILKAGAAYVPLDPDHPHERLGAVLRDTELSLLLTDPRCGQRLPAHTARVLCVGEELEAASPDGARLPAIPTTPDSLAYVIYTSGSTGKPKGIQVPHGAVVNTLFAVNQKLALTHDDVQLSVAPLSFDMSVVDVFLPLTVGACLVLVSRETAMDGERLAEAMARAGATVMQATPASWRLLTQSGWQGDERLKIVCGGEAVSTAQATELASMCGSLWNFYGPTECAVWATAYRVPRDGNGLEGSVPIGGPLANVQIYILDRSLQQVPVGVPGELCIGGAGLARGYSRLPDRTASAFVPDPFSGRPGARLYRTGDLARYRADGQIEFLGRIDHQVKVRGFRIELGEIEAVLDEHPGLRECAVTVHPEPSGENRLVAYVVAAGTEPPTVTELRNHLRQKLPEYMVPAAYVVLESLPLSPNGKVDRKALPAPDSSRPLLRQPHLEPRDSLELRLVRIWEELLGVRPVGVRDDFFDLGGHSLLAISLIARIQRELGRNLPLSMLARGATVEKLAIRLRAQIEPETRTPLVPLQPQRGAGGKPFFCVHPAGGTILCYVRLAQLLGPNQPFYALEDLDRYTRPDTAIPDMAAGYITAIRSVQPHGPYYLGGWSFGGIVAFEMARQLKRDGETVGLVALLDSAAPAIVAGYTIAEDALALAVIVTELAGRSQDEVKPLFDRLRGLDEAHRLACALAELKERGVVAPEVETDWMAAELGLFKGRTAALQNYVPEVYSDRIALFRVDNSQLARVENLPDQVAAGLQDPERGWGGLTTEQISIWEVPGDHGTMVHEPHVVNLAQQLRRCLDQAADDQRGESVHVQPLA